MCGNLTGVAGESEVNPFFGRVFWDRVFAAARFGVVEVGRGMDVTGSGRMVTLDEHFRPNVDTPIGRKFA